MKIKNDEARPSFPLFYRMDPSIMSLKELIKMAITKRKNTQLFLLLFLLGPVVFLTNPILKQITTDKAHDYHVK